MIKKQKYIDIKNKNLEFCENGTVYKLMIFKPKNMTVEVLRYENNKKVDTFELPFAHLPKKLKKIIKEV